MPDDTQRVATANLNGQPASEQKPATLLEKIKSISSIIGVVATVLAIIVGGWWTLLNFDTTAERKANLIIGHTLKVTRISDELMHLFHLDIIDQHQQTHALYFVW